MQAPLRLSSKAKRTAEAIPVVCWRAIAGKWGGWQGWWSVWVPGPLRHASSYGGEFIIGSTAFARPFSATSSRANPVRRLRAAIGVSGLSSRSAIMRGIAARSATPRGGESFMHLVNCHRNSQTQIRPNSFPHSLASRSRHGIKCNGWGTEGESWNRLPASRASNGALRFWRRNLPRLGLWNDPWEGEQPGPADCLRLWH